MRLPRKFLKFDYSVHILFGALSALSVVLIPLSGGITFGFLIMLWPLLGFWQMFSALILVLKYRDEPRAWYLLAVIVYGILGVLLINTSIGGYTIFLSLGFAVWYAYLTYKDATSRTPSFWDLEF